MLFTLHNISYSIVLLLYLHIFIHIPHSYLTSHNSDPQAVPWARTLWRLLRGWRQRSRRWRLRQRYCIYYTINLCILYKTYNTVYCTYNTKHVILHLYIYLLVYFNALVILYNILCIQYNLYTVYIHIHIPITLNLMPDALFRSSVSWRPLPPGQAST